MGQIAEGGREGVSLSLFRCEGGSALSPPLGGFDVIGKPDLFEIVDVGYEGVVVKSERGNRARVGRFSAI